MGSAVNNGISGVVGGSGRLSGIVGDAGNLSGTIGKSAFNDDADTVDGRHASDFATAEQGAAADTAVQSVKLGGTEYKDGTEVRLPAYPTALPASDVRDWAKADTKPSYTASEVGADASGTAASAVSAHNTSATAHDDIRQLITTLTNRVNIALNSDDVNLDQMSELVEYIKANRTSIESITSGKVNVIDIIDNLTSAAANKPLSANQGKALKDLIDALTQTVSGKADSSVISDMATKTWVGQQGFKTTDNNTTYTFAEGTTDGAFTVTPSGGTAQTVKVHGAITSHQDISGKVDKVTGKGLSTNDLTNDLKSHYDTAYTHSQVAHAPSDAEKNIIVEIQKNGTKVTPDNNRKVNITVPTKVSDLTNDSGFTANAGTITGIKMNGASKGTSGMVDLGTVLTSHQDISGKLGTSGDASNTTAAFAAASSRANITTGEKLSVIFGKTAKWFGDLGTWAFKSSGSPSDVGLGNVGNFKAVSTVASQGLSDAEKANARANIGAGTGSSNLAIGTTASTAAAGNHTHNYAGSSSAGGAATSANKLNTDKGSATNPVYFSGGVPVACTYSLSKSVPADAVFTDTNTWRGIQNSLTSDSATDSLSAAQGKVLKGLVDGKAASSHTHDDRYYTENEIDTKLNGKANSSHGNHVPATETANNAKFLRNDNTWQTVTPANIGAAASGHGHGDATTSASGFMSANDKKIVDAVSGENLIINWYFPSPINQRDGWIKSNGSGGYVKASKGESGAVAGYFGSGYTIDRWYNTSPLGSAKILTENGIYFAGAEGYGLIYAPESEYMQLLTGRTITVSALTSTGLLPHFTFTYSGLGSYQGSASDGDAVIDFTSASVPCLRLFSSASLTFVAVKMEIGQVQTLARQENGRWVLNDPPPDKALELLKCQRYYQIRTTNNLAAADMRPVMRISTPTVTAVTGGYAYDAEI